MITKVGIPAARLPAGADRARLLRLAHRGSEICHKWKAPLLAQICDALGAALIDLALAERRASTAERALAAARAQTDELRRRADELQHQLQAESFDVPTIRREASELLQHESRTATIDIPQAGEP